MFHNCKPFFERNLVGRPDGTAARGEEDLRLFEAQRRKERLGVVTLRLCDAACRHYQTEEHDGANWNSRFSHESRLPQVHVQGSVGTKD